MGYIHRHIDTRAYPYTTMHRIVIAIGGRGDSRERSDYGPELHLPYIDMFGDEINWGNGIVLVPGICTNCTATPVSQKPIGTR